MKTTTRQSYAVRIERARTYLLEHLDEAVDLERVPAVAHFSPYHFQRVYVAIVVETVAETLRRNRLNRAFRDSAPPRIVCTAAPPRPCR